MVREPLLTGIARGHQKRATRFFIMLLAAVLCLWLADKVLSRWAITLEPAAHAVQADEDCGC